MALVDELSPHLTTSDILPKKLLTPAEVADLLQVKLPRVYELVKTKRLRAVRVGRMLRVSPTEVERFIERNTVGQT